MNSDNQASDSSQAFTHHVLNQINPEIRLSLSKVQLQEISNAISAGAAIKKHPIDVRGVIPLFFTRIYFVLVLGRDKRIKTKKAEYMRRRSSDILANLVFYIMLMVPLYVIGALALYFLKSELGIDLFSELHLSYFLDF